MTPLFGVDVASYQGAPDYARVKAAGVSFVIAKATEGLGFTDPQYARNRAAIPSAGLVPGAYHFLRGTHDGASQAEAFVRVADPHAVHALDVECLADVRKLGRKLDVSGFVARYRQLLPGHPLMIYTGRDFWAACSNTGNPEEPLWTAGATPNAYVTGTGTLAQQWAKAGKATSGLPWGGWTSWAICQFTDAAQVPGIAGGVDGDAYGGTLDQLRALTGTTPIVEDDVTPDDYKKIQAMLDAHTAQVAAAVHSQQLYRATRTDGKPYTIADALMAVAPPTVLAKAVADAITNQLKALPAGTADLSPATVAELAGAVVAELGAALTPNTTTTPPPAPVNTARAVDPARHAL